MEKITTYVFYMEGERDFWPEWWDNPSDFWDDPYNEEE